MKTAEVLVQTLLDAGVSRIYGVSGDSLNVFTDTIRQQTDRMGSCPARRSGRLT